MPQRLPENLFRSSDPIVSMGIYDRFEFDEDLGTEVPGFNRDLSVIV